ncbi:MAG: hypothetical protein H6Q90_339 [Deltaproteobacteria bacterium]|nr:hypothetical protein [Deltaproteobacteria bacterium]
MDTASGNRPDTVGAPSDVRVLGVSTAWRLTASRRTGSTIRRDSSRHGSTAPQPSSQRQSSGDQKMAPTQVVRSNSRNTSAFSSGVKVVLHLAGKLVSTMPELTCMPA